MKIKLLIIISVLFCSSLMFGQSIFMRDFYSGKNSINLDYNRASFENTSNKTLGGFYRFTYVHPISKRHSIETSIGYFNNTYDKAENLNNGFSNLYLGINKLYNSGKSNLSLGVFLPTTSEKMLMLNAMLSSSYHFGLLGKNRVVIKGNYAYHNIAENGLIIGIETGPDFFIATKNVYTDRFVIFLHAAGRIGYKIDDFKIYGEVTNLVNVTSYFQKFKNRFVNHMGIGVSYKINNIEFGINYKNTFEDLPKYNNSFGVTLKLSGF